MIKTPSTALIATCVTFLHSLVFGIMSFQIQNTPPIAPRERLIVKTIQLEPKNRVIPDKQNFVLLEEKEVSPPKVENEVAVESPKIPEEQVVTKNEEMAPAEPIEVKKEEIQPVKNLPQEIVPVKKIAKKSPIKKPKPETKVATKKKKEDTILKPTTSIAKKTSEPKGPSLAEKKLEEERKAQVAKQIKLLAKAKESIAKIDISRDKLSQTEKDVSMNFAQLKTIDNLQIDALPTGISLSSLTDPESSYIAELRHRLELMLKLPERGDVKILLTLNRTGNVDKLTIVNSKSEANKHYVEGKLPNVNFSNFGTNFANHDNYTFQITLKNQ